MEKHIRSLIAVQRILGLSLVLILVFLLPACNGNGNSGVVVKEKPKPQPQSDNAKLSNLHVFTGQDLFFTQADITPAFDPDVFEYTLNLVNRIRLVTIQAITEDGGAILTISSKVESGVPQSFSMPVGSQDLIVEVESEDGSAVNQYTLHVTVADAISTNANLDVLAPTAGKLNETFNADVVSYTGEIGYLGKQLKLLVAPEEESAVVRVNGTSVKFSEGNASQTLVLVEGSNLINVEAQAPDLVTKKTYQLDVQRQPLSSVTQRAYVKADKNATGLRFGSSVALWGDYMAVGVPSDDSAATGVDGDSVSDCDTAKPTNCAEDSGAVYLFQRDASDQWAQIAYFKASNTAEGDMFGASVALGRDYLVVGAVNEDAGVQDSVAVNGNQVSDCETDVLNCAPNSGAVYIFTRQGTKWVQDAYVKAPNAGSDAQFGYRVSVDGDTVAVSAPGESDNPASEVSAPGSGAAYVYVKNNSTWQAEGYLKASDLAANDAFGSSLSLSGDTVAVGAVYSDDSVNSADDAGSVYVFSRIGSTWSQQQQIRSPNPDTGDNFGHAVSLHGNTLAVSALLEDSMATGINGDETDNNVGGSGAVFVFVRSGTSWTQQAYIKASNTDNMDFFGYQVEVEGDTLAVSSVFEDSNAQGIAGSQLDNSAVDSGAVYFFTRTGTVWTQRGYVKSSNSEAGDKFGTGMALAGDTLAVSAVHEDSNATGIDGDQTNNSSHASGAVYVFR